jgi:hypothetical protein
MHPRRNESGARPDSTPSMTPKVATMTTYGRRGAKFGLTYPFRGSFVDLAGYRGGPARGRARRSWRSLLNRRGTESRSRAETKADRWLRKMSRKLLVNGGLTGVATRRARPAAQAGPSNRSSRRISAPPCLRVETACSAISVTSLSRLRWRDSTTPAGRPRLQTLLSMVSRIAPDSVRCE